MKITLNHQSIHLKARESTLYDVLEQSQLPLSRIAVRVNKGVIPKAQWMMTQIHENDMIETITIVSGG